MWICSGIFFSTQRFPAAAQPFVQALPLTALNDALRAVMIDGSGVVPLLPELSILTVWGVAAFALARGAWRTAGRMMSNPTPKMVEITEWQDLQDLAGRKRSLVLIRTSPTQGGESIAQVAQPVARRIKVRVFIAAHFVVVFLWSSAVPAAEEGRTADRAEITARAMDYMEGWYEGNVERMRRALHPELVKRAIRTVEETGQSTFGLHSATTLLEGTRQGRGRRYPVESREIEVKILDLGEHMANVLVTCGLTREYLQMVRFDGHWRVLHVLFEFK
jgi:hypothetical protein